MGLFAFSTFLAGCGIKHLLRTGDPNDTELLGRLLLLVLSRQQSLTPQTGRNVLGKGSTILTTPSNEKLNISCYIIIARFSSVAQLRITFKQN